MVYLRIEDAYLVDENEDRMATPTFLAGQHQANRVYVKVSNVSDDAQRYKLQFHVFTSEGWLGGNKNDKVTESNGDVEGSSKVPLPSGIQTYRGVKGAVYGYIQCPARPDFGEAVSAIRQRQAQKLGEVGMEIVLFRKSGSRWYRQDTYKIDDIRVDFLCGAISFIRDRVEKFAPGAVTFGSKLNIPLSVRNTGKEGCDFAPRVRFQLRSRLPGVEGRTFEFPWPGAIPHGKIDNQPFDLLIPSQDRWPGMKNRPVLDRVRAIDINLQLLDHDRSLGWYVTDEMLLTEGMGEEDDGFIPLFTPGEFAEWVRQGRVAVRQAILNWRKRPILSLTGFQTVIENVGTISARPRVIVKGVLKSDPSRTVLGPLTLTAPSDMAPGAGWAPARAMSLLPSALGRDVRITAALQQYNDFTGGWDTVKTEKVTANSKDPDQIFIKLSRVFWPKQLNPGEQRFAAHVQNTAPWPIDFSLNYRIFNARETTMLERNRTGLAVPSSTVRSTMPLDIPASWPGSTSALGVLCRQSMGGTSFPVGDRVTRDNISVLSALANRPLAGEVAKSRPLMRLVRGGLPEVLMPGVVSRLRARVKNEGGRTGEAAVRVKGVARGVTGDQSINRMVNLGTISPGVRAEGWVDVPMPLAASGLTSDLRLEVLQRDADNPEWEATDVRERTVDISGLVLDPKDPALLATSAGGRVYERYLKFEEVEVLPSMVPITAEAPYLPIYVRNITPVRAEGKAVLSTAGGWSSALDIVADPNTAVPAVVKLPSPAQACSMSGDSPGDMSLELYELRAKKDGGSTYKLVETRPLQFQVFDYEPRAWEPLKYLKSIVGRA